MTLIPAGTRFEGIPVGTKIDLRSEQINESLTVYTMDDIAATVAADLPPSGLEGTSFILVKGEGTAEENGLELQAAYDAAKLATPYGNPLSNTNRFTILVAPGDYYYWDGSPFTAQGQFLINTSYVDIVSLSGNADVFLSGINIVDTITGPINVFLKGIDVTRAISLGGACNAFALNSTNNTLLTCDTCVGGDFSFGAGIPVNGTFVNCIAGVSSFAGLSTFSTPIGVNPGFSGTASGTFTNCVGGNTCFGSIPIFGIGIASGTFTNCSSGENSFGDQQASGVFKNCTGGFFSFSNPSNNGKFEGTAFNCISTNSCFGAEIMGGSVYYCKSSSTYPSINPIIGGRIILCIENNNTVRTESI
jgi:hypothetical protein